MDIRFVNPFVIAVSNTLTTMLGKTPQRLAPVIKKDNFAQGDISGIIGFAGKVVHGSVALSFPEATALKIYEMMVGEVQPKINTDIQDTVGELVNIVAGGAKTDFDREGLDFHISIPTVVVGKNHTIVHKGSSPVVVIPFQLESLPFSMEICLKMEASLSQPSRQARVVAAG
jgi:chemotaxis protein CheX